jgi:hypothetical protein
VAKGGFCLPASTFDFIFLDTPGNKTEEFGRDLCDKHYVRWFSQEFHIPIAAQAVKMSELQFSVSECFRQR